MNDIRKDFPILETGVVYLDSAATSLRPRQVVDAEREYYEVYNANIERGVYELSERASEEYELAHEKVAKLLGVKREEIVFTKNTTEAINLVALGLEWEQGDNIVTTLVEHHSNYLPWLRIGERYGVEVRKVRPKEDGTFELSDFEKVIDEKTKIVAVNHVSNVLGTVSPLEEIVEIAHKKGALVLADGAQSAPHLKVNLKEIGVDFFAASGHKMLGPTGTGVLYIKEDHFDLFHPPFLGGGVIEAVYEDSYTLTHPFERFEAGTPNIAGGIGLGVAAEYLMKVGLERIEEHERKLTGMLIEGLLSLGATVFGPHDPEKKTGVVPFEVPGMPPHQVAMLLWEMGKIAVRSGLHCAHPLHRYILKRDRGTVRASFYLYSTEEDVEVLLSTLKDLMG